MNWQPIIGRLPQVGVHRSLANGVTMSGRARDSFYTMLVALLVICIPAALALLLSEPRRPTARRVRPPVPSDVRPDELGLLFDKADKLVVLEGESKDPKVLFESAVRSDLDALKTAMRVSDPGQAVHCMCEGTPAIMLYADGEQIAEITNHHAHLLRCSLWKSDAVLVDAQAFLSWFDERQIAAPRDEYEANLERRKQSDAAVKKWLAAMPPALRPFWQDTLRAQPSKPDLAPLRKALQSQVPDRNARILALFSWYGSGRGPWSGFPLYEVVAEDLLLDYSTRELLQAIEGRELTPAQLEGVARLFGSYTFSRQRRAASLPRELKARLLKHSLATDNADKRRRAQSAFGSGT